MKTLTLSLDGTSPGKLSMARLTEYLCELAELLGSQDNVHFDCVSEGSALLNTLVEDDRYPHVIHRIREAGQGLGPKKALKAYSRLAALMEEDRVDGVLQTPDATILHFPKVKSAQPSIIVIKNGSAQGRLYIVGGKDESIPVRLEGANGESLYCEADTRLAEELGKLLFKNIRVHGKGEWESRPNGGWKLRKLIVQSYEVLEKVNFKTAVGRLRNASGRLWDEQENPHAAIQELRG